MVLRQTYKSLPVVHFSDVAKANFVKSPFTGRSVPCGSRYLPTNALQMRIAPSCISSGVKPFRPPSCEQLSYEYKVRDKLSAVRNKKFPCAKPSCQSRRSCASTRRAITRTHSDDSIRGASGTRRPRARLDHAGMSGIPVQNLKQNAKATPKYHGWY